jgi:hypothetical protein
VGVTDLGEQWTQSRSSSGSWPEEPQGNSQRTSVGSVALVYPLAPNAIDSHTLFLHSPQGALYTGPRHRPGGAHKSSLSREALGFDQNQPRHVSMPAGKFGAPLFATSSNSYDASQTDSDLANAMRGMAVVDEQSAQTTTMVWPACSSCGYCAMTNLTKNIHSRFIRNRPNTAATHTLRPIQRSMRLRRH